jgi:hypothetical protein
VDALAPFVVGDAEDGDVQDRGMTVERVFDLGRIDVDAARDDHVALAVADVHEAIVVDPRDVADREPVAPHRVARRFRLLPVFVEDAVVAPDEELAGRARRYGRARVVEHGELDARRGPPARAGLSQDVLRPEHGVHAELR